MDDPVTEIRDVVRALTEPDGASQMVAAVDKYFTRDAFIWHPLLNLPASADARENLKGIYTMLRFLTINNKIEFHGVMFSEDKLQAAIDLTEHLNLRFLPPFLRFEIPLRFLIFLELRREKDGKYRIWRQWDNFPTDLGLSGLYAPGLTLLSDVYKGTVGLVSGVVGRLVQSRGWLG